MDSARAPEAIGDVTKADSEIVTDFCIKPVAIVEPAKKAIGRPGKDVEAESDARILRRIPVEPWPDEPSGVLEILYPEDLRFERARQLGRDKDARADSIALDRQIATITAEKGALKALNVEPRVSRKGELDTQDVVEGRASDDAWRR